MNFTEEAARTKCCCAKPTSCSASNCMAWRWAKEPRLQFTQTLSVEKVMRIRQIDGYPNDPGKAVDEFMRESISDPAINAVLHNVSPDFVCTQGPDYDEEEGVISISFTRVSDDSATGYCGLATKPRDEEQ